MQLYEPQWGVSLLQHFNARASYSDSRFALISFLSDAIVFTFPIVLIALYTSGIYKKGYRVKQFALRIFFSSVIAALINILFQIFFEKPRPETALEGTGGLLLPHLPTMSFPSDHAAVAFAFSFALYFFSHSAKFSERSKKYVTWLSILFLLGSTIMTLSRIAVGIHWPTDILAGWCVGIIAVYICNQIPETFFSSLVKLQMYLGKILGMGGEKK